MLTIFDKRSSIIFKGNLYNSDKNGFLGQNRNSKKNCTPKEIYK